MDKDFCETAPVQILISILNSSRDICNTHDELSFVHTYLLLDCKGFLLNALCMVKQDYSLLIIRALCYIVSTLLQDFHRKLEIEKVDRRLSDSQALQLLEEVREQGKIAQQLREGEAK